MTPKEKGDGNRGGRTKWRSAGEDKKGKQECMLVLLCLCMWISAEARLPVHGVLGASDSERRYPAWHAHTEAPLMVAWLNPGQTLHCPSVPHLNWPTGQAGDDRTRKLIKQIIMSSGHDYWRTLHQISNAQCVLYRCGSAWICKYILFVRMLWCQMVADWQWGPCNEGYKLKTITVMNPIAVIYWLNLSVIEILLNIKAS